MKRTVADLFCRALNKDLVAFYFDDHIAVDKLAKFAFRTFYDEFVDRGYISGYAFCKCDRFFTYTRHKKLKIKNQKLKAVFSYRIENFILSASLVKMMISR